MRIALFCATARGERFLRELTALAPTADLHVMTFREEPWEPPFVDAIRLAAEQSGARFTLRGQGGQPFDGEPFDLLLAVSWRFFVGPEIRARASRGAWLIHDSLLPEYRGFSPTVWAIVNGEDHTGATLLEMADGIDEGGIVDQRRVEIAPADTIATVMDRVTVAYIDLLRGNFDRLVSGARTTTQDASRATYGCKRLPEDNRIDWSAPTRKVLDLIRGVTRPYPGAWTTLDDARLTIWSAAAATDGDRYVGRVPGRVVSLSPVTVLTGDGAIVLNEIEPGRMIEKLSATLR